MIPELKVPFLHEKQVERAANELLHKYAKDKGKPVRAPIDVENILEGYFKLDLVYIDLPDFIGVPDVLGATFIKDQRVFIDESLMIEGKEGRLAFTLAHEGGHWYLHRPLIEMEQVTASLARPFTRGLASQGVPAAVALCALAERIRDGRLVPRDGGGWRVARA